VDPDLDPDEVGSASFCRINIGIKGMPIRIRADPDWYQFQTNDQVDTENHDTFDTDEKE
jgi:hypothetical protein